MHVSCLALITNPAGGRPGRQLSHQDVLRQSAVAIEPMQNLLTAMVPELMIVSPKVDS
jgi:purine nucleoside phosphorylase